jgi:hypothetical protein
VRRRGAFGLALWLALAATATVRVAAEPATPAAEPATAAAKPAAPAAQPAPAPAPPEALPNKDVAPLVKAVFEKNFRFCTDPAYPLTSDELKWCALLGKDDTRCPALAKACNRGATAEVVGQRARPQRSTSISLPSVGLPGKILLWIVLGAVVFAIVYAIAKQSLGQRTPDREEAIEVATDAPEDPAAAAARQVETDVQRLLDRARAAAAAGDFAGGVGDAYAALLRKLEGGGIVTIESHRTNGDHVRDVGRQVPALRPRMQAVVSNVEEVQFGGGPPTEGHYRAVLTGVVGLLGEKLAACLPFVINLGLGLGLATMLAGCSIDRDRWDHSPSGRAGVIDLLQRYGFTPRERLIALSKIDKSVSSLVLLPGASVDEAGWDAIAAWTSDGGSLLIAGGQRTLPAWIGAQAAPEAAGPATPTPTPKPAPTPTPKPAPLTVPAGQSERLPRLKAVVPGGKLVKISPPPQKPDKKAAAGDEQDEEEDEDEDEEYIPPAPLLLREKTPYAVEATYEGGGRAIVLADDRLLTNASLLVDDNARLLIELLRPGGAKLELAGELTGLVSQNPVTSVQRSRLGPAMLQLSLLIVLFFIYKGAHFGRPVDPAAASRRAFAEHARAIGLLYGRTRAGRHALEVYGSYALERMRERLNLVGGKGMLAVAEEVATRTGRPLGEVMRVLVESRPHAHRDPDPVREKAMQEANCANDLEMLRDLAKLNEQLGTLGGSRPPR